MNNFIAKLKDVEFLGASLFNYLLFFVILLSFFIVKYFLLNFVINISKRFVKKFNIDEKTIDKAKRPLNILVYWLVIYISEIILFEHYKIQYYDMIYNVTVFAGILVVGMILLSVSNILSAILLYFARKTETKIDDLLIPIIESAFKVFIIFIIIAKFFELFLGKSIMWIFTLLGGAGITLGLVFKDLILNWFGYIIIHIDNLYKVGDWISVEDGRLVDGDVEYIGYRSTKIRNFDKTVTNVPNDYIVSRPLKNWSRMYKRRVVLYLKIDDIKADIMEKFLEDIRTILRNDDDIHQEFHMVNFREIEENARVIRLYYFTKTTKWEEHEKVREKINIKLLKLFEKYKISVYKFYNIKQHSSFKEG